METKFWFVYSYAFDDWCVVESKDNPNKDFVYGGATEYDTLEEATKAFNDFNKRRR